MKLMAGAGAAILDHELNRGHTEQLPNRRNMSLKTLWNDVATLDLDCLLSDFNMIEEENIYFL